MVEVILAPDCPDKAQADARARQEVLSIIARNGGRCRPKRVRVSFDSEADDYIISVEGMPSIIGRTRRISGYLTDENNFNSAKLSELHDRRPHSRV